MRAQNQLSFADWQNLVLFTKKKKFVGKNFRWRFPMVNSSGSDGHNGARWWAMEKREEKKEKTVAAIKAAQKK